MLEKIWKLLQSEITTNTSTLVPFIPSEVNVFRVVCENGYLNGHIKSRKTKTLFKPKADNSQRNLQFLKAHNTLFTLKYKSQTSSRQLPRESSDNKDSMSDILVEESKLHTVVYCSYTWFKHFINYFYKWWRISPVSQHLCRQTRLECGGDFWSQCFLQIFKKVFHLELKLKTIKIW